MATFKSWGKSFWAAICLSAFSTIVGFRVYGDATPQVSLAIGDSYMETYSRESIQVGINYYSGDPIVVKLTVTPPDRANPGELVLDSTYKTVPTGYPVLGDNEYYVSLRKYDSLASVGIVSMDGTAASSMYGFRIKAEVVTPEWSDVYVPATKCVYVHNVAPTVDSVTPESPNAMMAPGGVASTPISWQVRSDVDADLAAGITVRFEGCENAFTTNVTEATGGSFVPDFGSWIGSQTVTMTIEDKDGGMLAYSYLYEVLPSKFLRTLAHGPGVGMAASALSQRYERASGRGEGHVYAYGATLSMASNFAQTWNCSHASTVSLMGSGYKVGDVDNGWLDNGRDSALTARGDAADTAMQATDTAGFYRYGDDERDSFLYLWIFHPVDENGMPSDIVPGGTATPEILGRSNPVLSAALPSMVGDDGFYPLTTVEAVFSKEWLAADNLGDINQDGVPDMFAMKTWRAGDASLTALATGGETLANDMVNIGVLNLDESYLPRTSYGDFTNEVPFTVRLQLRGVGYGLNDAVLQTIGKDVSERVYAIPTTNTLGEVSWGWSNACSLNELEFYAWRAYAGENGLDWTDPSNWTEWSPERPTDPTVSDTDGDGMPDGFEYRYWYLAHVGYFEMNADGQKVFRQLEGCRFDPKDPLGFQVVPAREIAALMDPLTPTEEDATTRDSDNDGVSDLAEIQAGQDPFDFHDAIHLPYYEIEDGVLLSVYMGEEASAVIPHTVTSIGDYAFDGCSGLTSITIPNSVTNIGKGAFSTCYSLTNIVVMTGDIGEYAFRGVGCDGMLTLVLGEGVTSIGRCAFADCYCLRELTVPSSVTNVADLAFQECCGITNLTVNCERAYGTLMSHNKIYVENRTVTIGEGCRYIDDWFGSDYFIRYLEIGSNVETIGDEVFSGCDMTEVQIPDSVTDIGTLFLANCHDLTNVVFGAGVTNIGGGVLAHCENLKTVVFKGSAAPTFEESESWDSFFRGRDISPDLCIYVAKGSTGWGVDIPGMWNGARIEYYNPSQVAVEVNGAAVEFETAADGKTRTATVAAGTTAEDVKVFVGGVDVTAGFKVSVEGTTAMVVLKEPYEGVDDAASEPKQAWTDNGDGSVTLNVEVVPGLYYAADSAATIEALKRPGAAEPAKAGDAVVAPKQTGVQGFYKVWVSDGPIEAE